MGLKRGRNKDLYFVLYLLFISILWNCLVFDSFKPFCHFDWDVQLTSYEIQRKIIVDYRQVPLWNPYWEGGIPMLALPQSEFLSPYFLFILLFGSFYGSIVNTCFQAFIGLCGIYFLSRHFGLKRHISLIGAVFFLHVFNFLVFIGMSTYLNASLLPWIFLFFLKSRGDKKYLIFTAILFSLLLFGGTQYHIVVSFLVLLLYSLLYLIKYREKVYLINLILVSFLFLLIGSIKLIPMIELAVKYPRYYPLNESPTLFGLENFKFSLLELKILFFSKKGEIFDDPNLSNLSCAFLCYKENCIPYRISILSLAIILSSFFLLWKSYKSIVIINFFLILLVLGENSPINIWRILHFLPIFSSLREPFKFLIELYVFLSLSLAISVSIILEKLKGFRVFYVILCFFIYASIFLTIFDNATYISKKGRIADYCFKLNQRFQQTYGSPRRTYRSICANQGVINSLGCIAQQFKIRSVVAKDNPRYKGEYYLLRDAEKSHVDLKLWTPNKIIFFVDLKEPNKLIINQNYFPGWKSNRGKIINYSGLLGVELDKGKYTMEIYYLPPSVIWGLVITITTLFGLLILYKLKEDSKS